jgi:hypothetical protein
VDLTLNFLFKLSHTDVNILKDIKQATEGRSNVLHNATVVAHAYMNAGMYRTFSFHHSFLYFECLGTEFFDFYSV